MNVEYQESEVAELCDALVDGTFAGESKQRLFEMLRVSEAARECYLRQLGLSASLFEFAADTTFAQQKPSAAEVPSPFARRFWWPMIAVASAAAIIVAVVLRFGIDRDVETDANEFAAQVTGLENCIWADARLAPTLGDALPPGQQLQLQSGIAEITFDSGAQVTLEGPATLELNSAWEGTLHRGKLRAEVPPEAIGFAIQSATVDVVDLGTEFGMTVDAAGSAEVCVLEGAVEATSHDSTRAEPAKFVIKQQSARRFNRAGSKEIENPAGMIREFKRPAKLERLAKTAKHVHWTFDETDGREGQADGTWPGVVDLAASLETTRAPDQSEPRVAGRWGTALRFDGHLHVRATVPGLSSRAAHTVAFWCRISSETSIRESGPIISWITKAQDSANVQPVQIFWNSNPAQGTVGALRTEVGRITAIGSSNLRDGQWHHVAVVIVPHNTGKQRWHVRQYVDGRLETTSNKGGKKSRSDTIDHPADDMVWIGRAAWRTRAEEANFHGELDELFIIDRALTPQQIGGLFKANSLSGSSVAEIE